MRTAADNRRHQRRTGGSALPAPDYDDLRHLRAVVLRGPDRAFTPSPCFERLRFAGYFRVEKNRVKGDQIVITEAGEAALAEAGLAL